MNQGNELAVELPESSALTFYVAEKVGATWKSIGTFKCRGRTQAEVANSEQTIITRMLNKGFAYPVTYLPAKPKQGAGD